ncbi:GntR family transcriptional regulator [Compostimonas suwonensis]|uniref:DNA-binding GntR family transcriptional regulator n=1 Tax=Compostimonas suwonensis TaxID=1048394 RepID=A0A2M9BWC6_9MICO|nr:GntR family transcriptional regulator [Compostimonas suwonensis]PJJ62229.1 DNA-binding GntR family transcriptional regulator [Compostimonas suwonensis]
MNRVEYLLPAELFADLDRWGADPLYEQVAHRIERAIAEGHLPSGARLENEIAFGERVGLSRPTVRRAIQQLVDKGFVVRRRGIGTQVVQGTASRELQLTSLFEALAKGNKHPTTVMLAREMVPASETVAEGLGVDAATPVLRLKRVRLAEGVPVAVMENFLPGDLNDIDEHDLVEHGLYQVLRARGNAIRVARQGISARLASEEECRLLMVDAGSPVLTMQRTVFDDSGRAIDYGNHSYRPDMYTIEVTLVDK